MSVLITGGDSRLARAVAAALAAEGAIRLVDARFSAPLPANVEGREGDLCDPAFVAAALEGVEQVLHLAPLAPPATDDFAVLDAATRGTYVLMTGAIDAGVPKFILGSTLDLFDRLPAHWRVTEAWRPRP